MEKPNTRKRRAKENARAEENARIQTEIAEDLAKLEEKIQKYWSKQDVCASPHDRRLLSTIVDRAVDMKKAWESYVEVDVMQPSTTNNNNFVTENQNFTGRQFYPRLANDFKCHKPSTKRTMCGFTPYFRCRKHFLTNPERSGNLNELDYPMVEGVKNFTKDPNGLPVMETITEGPQIFIYVKYNYQSDNTVGTYNEVGTDVFEAMALPDSGCTRTICNPEYARKCQLIIDHTEGMDMAGANGEMLSFIGSTNAVISYYGRVATIKIFVMKNFKQDFFLLSRRACQALQILPPEFPLPIQMCDPEKLTNPIVH